MLSLLHFKFSNLKVLEISNTNNSKHFIFRIIFLNPLQRFIFAIWSNLEKVFVTWEVFLPCLPLSTNPIFYRILGAILKIKEVHYFTSMIFLKMEKCIGRVLNLACLMFLCEFQFIKNSNYNIINRTSPTTWLFIPYYWDFPKLLIFFNSLNSIWNMALVIVYLKNLFSYIINWWLKVIRFAI